MHRGWNQRRGQTRLAAAIIAALAAHLLAYPAASAVETVLWYDKPAADWARGALPVGNGELGAMVFGKTDLERIQFNEKSLWTGNEEDPGAYQAFGDLLIELGHRKPSDYRRALDLARGVQTVSYVCNGVRYQRELFASHPTGVIAIRLTADKPGAYSGKLWLTDMHGADVLADGNRLTATGVLNNGLDYESQALIVSEGGTVAPVFEPGFVNQPLNRIRPEASVLDGTKDVYLSLSASDKPIHGYLYDRTSDDANTDWLPLVIDGEWFDRGISFRAANDLNFTLDGKYRWLTFHALVAEGGLLQICLDGTPTRDIPPAKTGEYVSIPVAGVKKLTLRGITKLQGSRIDPKAHPEILLGHLRVSPADSEPAKDPGIVRSWKSVPGVCGMMPPVALAFDRCDGLTILLGAKTSYLADHTRGWRGAHPHEALTSLIDKAAKQPFSALLTQHEEDYRALFDRVTLDLGTTDPATRALPTDQRLARYAKGSSDPELDALFFHHGRYLLISSSRPGGLPANLQGVWNESNRPAWRCDYHTDLNVQMNYWLAGPANLSECVVPLFDWCLASREVLRRQTAAMFHARGWTTRGENGVFGGGSWKWVPASSAWLCQNLFEQYEFTQDREYLERLYPVLKEVCEFWEDLLKPLPDGTLVAPNEYSPEHGPTEDGVSFAQELVWDLFNNYVQAEKVLGVDPQYGAKIAGMRDRLLVPKIGKWGQLQEWMVDRDDPNDRHRHTAHLVGLHPGRQITPRGTPDLARAAAVSLEARGTTGDARVSWTWSWRCALWARLGQAEKAYEMLRGCAAFNLNPNLFTRMGYSVVQIEGSLGTTAGIAEMLLQSHTDEIELLPALPNAWPTGSVKGLRARGNVAVDIEWKDGKVTGYRIASVDPHDVKVRVNGETKTIRTEKP